MSDIKRRDLSERSQRVLIVHSSGALGPERIHDWSIGTTVIVAALVVGVECEAVWSEGNKLLYDGLGTITYLTRACSDNLQQCVICRKLLPSNSKSQGTAGPSGSMLSLVVVARSPGKC